MVLQPQCTIHGCEKPHNARGWCAGHYGRWRRYGDPTYVPPRCACEKCNPPPRPTEAERFWTKVDFAGPVPKHCPELGPCWLWTGATAGLGYGHFGVSAAEDAYAHRYAYEFCIDYIPDGLTIDHLCQVRLCANPYHLEVVTHRTNILRSPVTVASINARKTHCIRGHKFTPENTYIRPGYTGRACKACTTEKGRRYYQRKKQEAAI